MFCKDCPKKKTCTKICPDLETHLKEDEVYMREMLVSPKKLEWLASQLYTGEWFQRHPEYRERLRGYLQELPGEDRALLEMKFEEGMSYRKIGDKYKLSKKQVGRKIRGILLRLRSEIERNSE